MNFTKIYEMQVALDESIQKTHNIDPSKIIDKKVLALIVEIAEFANEYAPFKYWKINKNINREMVVEEFVDGIHFFVSLGLFVNANRIIEPKIVFDDQSKQLLETIRVVGILNGNLTAKTLEEAFAVYMGNAKLLKITDEELEKHYLAKNKINFERLKNKY